MPNGTTGSGTDVTRALSVVDDRPVTPRRASTTKDSDPAYVPELRSRGVVPSTEQVPTKDIPDEVETGESTLVAEFQTLAYLLSDCPTESRRTWAKNV